MTETPLRIVRQGAVIVRDAILHRSSSDIACIYVNLGTKRAELLGADACSDDPPRAYFIANDDSLHLDESQPRDEVTIIEFADFPKWSVFATNGPGKCTFGIVLVKRTCTTSPSVT